MQNTAPYRPSFSFEALPALAVATRLPPGPWLGWINVRPVIRVPAKCLTLFLNAQVLRRFESLLPVGCSFIARWVGQETVATVLQGLPRMGWFYETRPTFTMHAHVFCALVGDGVKVRPVIWVVAEGAAFFIFQALCLHFWQRLPPILVEHRDVGEIQMSVKMAFRVVEAAGRQLIGLARPQILPLLLHAHRLLRTTLCLRLAFGILNAIRQQLHASIKLPLGLICLEPGKVAPENLRLPCAEVGLIEVLHLRQTRVQLIAESLKLLAKVSRPGHGSSQNGYPSFMILDFHWEWPFLWLNV